MAPQVRLVTSLLLVDLSILALVLHHVAQPDDTSGGGSDVLNLPLGVLAAGLGIAAVVVATAGRRAQAGVETTPGTEPARCSTLR